MSAIQARSVYQSLSYCPSPGSEYVADRRRVRQKSYPQMALRSCLLLGWDDGAGRCPCRPQVACFHARIYSHSRSCQESCVAVCGDKNRANAQAIRRLRHTRLTITVRNRNPPLLLSCLWQTGVTAGGLWPWSGTPLVHSRCS